MKRSAVFIGALLLLMPPAVARAEENPETGTALMDKESAAVWERTDALNHELEDYPEIIPKQELDGLLQTAVELIQYENLGKEFDRLNEQAYVADNYAPINAGVKRAAPAIVVVSGPFGFRLGVNLHYLLSKTHSDTPEHRFFQLADLGWNDGYADHGGPDEWPSWAEATNDLDGKDLPKIKERRLAEWRQLQPQLTGYFRRLAETTLQRLERKTK